MAQPKYKLTYLDGKGRAEVMRFVFAYRNIPYEDVRIPYGPEWNKVKNDFPWGEVPVLEIDGKVLAQSGAILRFLGKKHDLAGDNEYESAKCDEMWESLSDLQTPTWTMYMEPMIPRRRNSLRNYLMRPFQSIVANGMKSLRKMEAILLERGSVTPISPLPRPSIITLKNWEPAFLRNIQL